MRIALDYDGTFTEDPTLWLQFAAAARQRGHKVFMVTMRYEHEAEDLCMLVTHGLLDGLICTRREAKKPHLEKRGILPMDVWIDDNPEWVLKDSV